MRHRTAIAALLAACWLGAPPGRAEGRHDTLTIGIAQFPSSLQPDIDAEVVRSYALGFVIRQITAFGPDWKNACLLCTDLPTLDNGLAKIEDRAGGNKGMAITIKLKPGLAWGDGVPVTAKDIAFTWKLGSDPGSGFSNPNPWNRATSVDVVDDSTAVLHLDRVRADFNQWDQILPEHIEGPVVAKATGPGEYINATAYNRAPLNPGLYDGPYLITGYDSGAQIVLEPNPHWGGTRPGFRRIVLRHIENTAALQANLLSGDVDMVAGEGIGLTIDQALALQKLHPDAFHYEFKPSLTYEHVDLKKENPLLADVRVRRALQMAIDRQTLVQKLFNGTQPAAATWVNPLSPYYDSTIPVVKFDMAGARALLKDAGWTPGPDGICRNAAGDRLSLELGTTAGNRLRELQEQVLQSNLKTACVEVTIKNEPARTLFGETLKKRTFTGMVMYAWSSNVTETPLRTLGTSQIPAPGNNYGGANFPGFSDAKMDADISAAEAELDPQKQKAIWADMQRIYAEQLPALPLFYRAEGHITPTWLRGYVPTGQGDVSSYWAEKLALGVIRAATYLGTLLLAAPAAAAGAHPDLVIGVSSFPSTMLPPVNPEGIKAYILGFADRPVTTFDAAGHLSCMLCTDIPSLANGGAALEDLPDGRHGIAVTFHFRPGLQWGDGAPLGAVDLAFTARVGRDPKSGFANTHAGEIISRVDVIDRLTAVVHYSEVYYQFDQFSELLPAHLEQAVFDHAAGPGEYMLHSVYNTAPSNPGLYNGPYLITGYDTGARVVLQRNPYWHGPPASFERIVVKTIGNTAALQTNLLSGDVDMIPGDGVGLTLDQVLALQKRYPDRFAYAYKPNLNYAHIDTQLDNPILADARVRRALLLGINRQSMVDRLMGGRVPIANSFVSPLEPVYSADVPSYPYDPERARGLLAEAGWTPGADGICHNAAGQRLSLEFSTSAGVRARELLQEVMQSEWRRIGVETVIRNEPARTLFGETLKHRTFKGLVMFSWSSSIESTPRQILSSGQIPTEANNWGGSDYTDFRDPTMDADIDAMEKDLDPAGRRVLWAEMQRIYAEKLPVLPLFFGSEAHVWPLWLKGVTPTGHNAPTTLWAEYWLAE